MTELIDIIIPCFNEAATIRSSITETIRQLNMSGLHFRLTVVDDGSTDDTGHIVKELMGVFADHLHLIQLPSNEGKGAAVKAGIKKTRGAYVFFTDADIPYHLGIIAKCLTLFKEHEAEIVIGARDLPDSVIRQPYPAIRKIFSRSFSHFVQILLRTDIRDTQCGLKGFKRHVANDIFDRTCETGYAFDVEIIVAARRLGYNIQKVPVDFSHTSTSSVNLIKDSVRMLSSLFRIKNRLKNGLYD